jgi:hypothetical protein
MDAICDVCGWPLSREHLHLLNHRCDKQSAAGAAKETLTPAPFQ